MSYPLTRRDWLRQAGLGFGTLALTGTLQDAGLLAASEGSHATNLQPRQGHFPGRARAVIQLFQNGGPSQMDMFDEKPELTQHNGEPRTS